MTWCRLGSAARPIAVLRHVAEAWAGDLAPVARVAISILPPHGETRPVAKGPASRCRQPSGRTCATSLDARDTVATVPPVSPTTTKHPRLATIDPTALGNEIVTEYVNSIVSAAFYLSPGRDVLVTDSGEFTQIGCSIADLVRYARGEAALDDVVEEYLLTMLPMLEHPLGRALPERIHQAVYESIDVDNLGDDPIDRLALVIAAALGRQAIDSGESARPSWLAAFTSVSVKTVERAAASGDGLERDEDGWITAESARRWYEARRSQAKSTK